MFIKKIMLFLLFSFVVLVFNAEIFADYDNENEKTRLYNSLKRRSDPNMSTDITFSKEVVTKPKAVEEKKKKNEELSRELSREYGRPLRAGSFGLPLPDGSEILLSKTRRRISGFKLHVDTTIFANKEKTETNYEATIIDTGFGKDDLGYFINHKAKTAQIWSDKNIIGYDVLRFGKVDEKIVMDIMKFCNPEVAEETSKEKIFIRSDTKRIEGKIADEIEFINLEDGQIEYTLSLDTNDWSRCRKIVWYDKESGLVSESVESKEFSKAQGSDELFPRLVIKRYFDKKGEEIKTETIKIENIIIGESISEDVFSLETMEEYSITDLTVSPPKIIKQKLNNK